MKNQKAYFNKQTELLNLKMDVINKDIDRNKNATN
jgi:hypothetical protein